MAAALAFYTAFALAPLLLIAVAVASLAFGEDAARGEVVHQLGGLIGETGARTIQEVLENAWRPKRGVLATLIGVGALFFAAMGVFGELQDSLNQIWKVRKRPGRGVLGVVRDRFFSFTMVLGVGFLLLVSLIVSTILEATANYLERFVGGSALVHAINFVASLGVIVILFAAIFKILPDAQTRWRDVWMGAVVTGVLFDVGKLLIGLYLGRSTIGSTYGAAGSFVVFLLWINYSTQIMYLGAAFTKAYADLYGTSPPPVEGAQRIPAVPAAPTGEVEGHSTGRP